MNGEKNCSIFFFNIENYVTRYSIVREKENHKSEFKLTYYYIYYIHTRINRVIKVICRSYKFLVL